MADTKTCPPEYLTVERFEKFVSNDFCHLKMKVDATFWVTISVLGAIIAKWVVG